MEKYTRCHIIGDTSSEKNYNLVTEILTRKIDKVDFFYS